MVLAITKYSPLDIDSLLSGHSRTLDCNEEADILYLFKYDNNQPLNHKIVLVFNSAEYCLNRGITILDANNENILNIVNTIKESVRLV